MEFLNNVYIACLAGGFFYSIISFALSGILDFFDIDVGGDISDGLDLVAFLPIKPFTVLAFMTVFGGAGFIFMDLKIFGELYLLTLIPAILLGYISAQLIYRFVYIPLYKAQRTVKKQSAAIGLNADVLETIIPGGFGRISYRIDSNILSAPAKEKFPGNGIKKGEEVIIEEIKENVFYVSKLVKEENSN